MLDIGGEMVRKQPTFCSSSDRYLVLIKVDASVSKLYLCQIHIVYNLSVCQ